MSATTSASLISVYSSALAYEADLVKAMLADEGIVSSVVNANGPFPGLAVIPCEVLVSKTDETRARELVEEHEAKHRARIQREYDGTLAEDTEEFEV